MINLLKKKGNKRGKLFNDMLMSLNDAAFFFYIIFEDFSISLIII